MADHLAWENDGPPLSRADIDEAERLLGIRFPDDHRKLLESRDGGGMQPNYFKPTDPAGLDHFDWIELSFLCRLSPEHIQSKINRFSYRGLLEQNDDAWNAPADAIIIALADYGDCVLFYHRDTPEAGIFGKTIEEEAEPAEGVRVASSLTEILEALTTFEG
ncbi:MAG: SMI1/KNR4 family protein [Planctomycetota bacterium]